MPKNTNTPHCSFCGKAQDEVRKLISGPNGVFICNECVDLCHEIIAENERPEKGASETEPKELPTPQ